MSQYSEKLAKLKKDISSIENAKKKKRWKPNQKIMIDFINGVTKKAEFKIRSKTILLFVGDDKKGFKHIVEKHYSPATDLTTLDIINISEAFERGIKLAEEGVSNTDLDVYWLSKGSGDFRLVLKANANDSWIVTFYRKS